MIVNQYVKFSHLPSLIAHLSTFLWSFPLRRSLSSNSVPSFPDILPLGFLFMQAGNLWYMCDVFPLSRPLPITPDLFYLFFSQATPFLCHYLNSGFLLPPVILPWPTHYTSHCLLWSLHFLKLSVEYLIHMSEVKVVLKVLEHGLFSAILAFHSFLYTCHCV